jgi:nucleoside-diphosphate-sugar epimerase
MSRILVTGASGFIGSHLVKALVERGDEVTALVRKTSRVGVRLAYGDLSDPESLAQAVAGQSVVYHLAGCAKARRVRQYYQVNETGQEGLCRACADQANPPVLVAISSLAAAGPAPQGRAKTEEDPSKPVSHYGRSKRAGELAAERYADRVPTTIVRPPIVFGEGDPACFQMFKAIQLTGIHFVPGFRPRKYSLIHAADLVDLVVRAAADGERLPPATENSPTSGGQGYYFADCREQPSYYQLGRLIGDALGKRFVIRIPFGPIVVCGVSLVFDTLARIRRDSAFFSFDKARDAIAGSWICSAEKAASQLGFSVTVPLADRLRQTAEWYRTEKWL